MELPNSSGWIIRLIGDQKKGESKEQYIQRCVQEIASRLDRYLEHYGILVTGTILSATVVPQQNLVDEVTSCARNIRQKLQATGTIASNLQKDAHWGHISMFGQQPQEFLSHLPDAPKNRNDAIKHDVETAVNEKSDFRYLSLIPKHAFPRTLEKTRLLLSKFELRGERKSSKDNCSTACMKEAGISNDIAQQNRNPLMAFHQILNTVVAQKLSVHDKRIFLGQITQFGITFDLEETALEQCRMDVKKNREQRPSLNDPDTQNAEQLLHETKVKRGPVL